MLCENEEKIIATLYLFILLHNIKGRSGFFSMDIAQIVQTTYICLSYFMCFCICVSVIFYVFFCSVIYNFLTIPS